MVSKSLAWRTLLFAGRLGEDFLMLDFAPRAASALSRELTALPSSALPPLAVSRPLLARTSRGFLSSCERSSRSTYSRGGLSRALIRCLRTFGINTVVALSFSR